MFYSTRSLDKLFNVEALIPARPTISNLQWIAGTSYVSPADMDKLSKSDAMRDYDDQNLTLEKLAVPIGLHRRE